MEANVYSPITGSSRVRFVEQIDTEDIFKLYEIEAGIEVERFFKGIDAVSIFECADTGFRFYYPGSVAGDDKFYEDLQKAGEKNNRPYYRVNEFDHQFALSQIKDGDRVLEVGCGNAFFIESVMPVTPHVAGLELNKYTAALCRERGLEVYPELIEDHSAKHRESYDVVCSFQVLEHVPDVRSFLTGCLAALKKGGRLIISVPNNEPYFMRYNKFETLNLPPHHVGLWNEKVFRSLEKFFPLTLKQVVYSARQNWKADSYHRVKSWIGSKSVITHHTLWEKVKMAALLPFSVPVTVVDILFGRIRGGQICVLFEKN